MAVMHFRKSFLQTGLLVGLVTLSLFPMRSLVSAQEAGSNFWRVRSIPLVDYGIPNPGGFAFSPEANAFILSGASNNTNTNLDLINMREDPAGSVTVASAFDAPLNMAFDGKANSLFTLNRGTNQLVEIQTDNSGRPDRLASAVAQASTLSLGIGEPQGMTFDPDTGRLFILDSAKSQIVIVTPHPTVGFKTLGTAAQDGRLSRISLSSLGQVSLRGIAFNPGNGHLYISNPDEHKLYEMTESGGLVSTFDLTSLQLADPQAMLFAPSGDATDDPATMDLFILDSGQTTTQKATQTTAQNSTTQSQSGQIVELALVAPAALPPGTTLLPSTLVHTIDASNAAWNPSAPDTSGVAYWPLTGRLLIPDSEVEEMPPYWQGVNVFQSTLAGSLTSTCTTFVAKPLTYTYNNFSYEPTGVAINPNNNHIFFSDDSNGGRLVELGLGPDNTYCTSDDTVTLLELPSIYAPGIDFEDVAYAAGTLYLAGGIDAEVYKFSLGANGVLGGGDDGAITHWDTAAAGFADVEGVGYNADQGTVFVASTNGSDKYLGEFTSSGTLLRAYDLNYLGSVARSSVTLAPSSGNPAIKNIYMASRGVDNGADPNENDGKIWEISLSGGGGNTPPTVSSPIADVNVLEDAANTTIDLWPSFADAENTDAQLTYTVTGNTNAALFTSVTVTGAPNRNLVLDYAPNGAGTANITVRATDTGGLFVEDTFTVTVTAVNDAPTNIGLSASSVAENQAVNTVVGTLSSTDPDAGDTFTYSLVMDGTACPAAVDNASFNILTNQLRTSASFDFETKSSYSICIRSTDSGSLPFNKQFTVTVTNVNEAPTNINLSNSSVAENQAVNTVVGALSSTDPDAGGSFSYSLVADAVNCPAAADNASFNISGSNLRTSASFNFEVKSSYSICLRTTDQGSLTFTKPFTITVTNANDAPAFTSSPATVATQGVLYTYNITAADPDAGATLTITAPTKPAWLAFTNNGNGTATLSGTPGNGDIGPNNVTLNVSDGIAAPVVQSFTITVGNANDAPVITEGASIGVTMSEDGSPTAFSLTLHATDPDVGDVLTWSISTVASHGTASASGTGTSKVIGYAPTANYAGPDSFVVQVSDGHGGIDTITVNVTITAVNDGGPTNISLSNASINENRPAGTLVGSLSSTDPDVGDTFTYSFCGGADDASFMISGANLQSAVIFDYETKNSYSICVRSTDIGSLSTTKTFVISINNTVDAATFADVPMDYWAWSYIESIYAARITGGCGTNPLIYCPTAPVTRAQMAVFLLRGIHGGSYNPPPATGTRFTDVPASYWAAAWIEQLATEGITGGCGTGIYCPDATVTRDQMAVFLLKAKHGSSYAPPAVGSSTGFTDVATSYWAAAWIKQLAAEGITGGCGAGTYCPTSPVTRDQMAVFLQRVFNLPLQ